MIWYIIHMIAKSHLSLNFLDPLPPIDKTVKTNKQVNQQNAGRYSLRITSPFSALGYD